MLRLGVVAGLLAFACVSAQLERLSAPVAFTSFQRTFHRSYPTAEERTLRNNYFMKNYALINEHNARNTTYKLGLNRFSDLSHEEFVGGFLGALPPTVRRRRLGNLEDTENEEPRLLAAKSRSPTRTISVTRSDSRSVTLTRTTTRTPTGTRSVTKTPKASRSPSKTPSGTKSVTRSPSGTRSPTKTVTPSRSETRTITPTKSVTKSTSVSRSPQSATPSKTPISRSATRSPSDTRTQSKSPTLSRSVSSSISLTKSITTSSSISPSNPPPLTVTSRDWKDFLTPIKDQQQCGACWAFASTDAVEALNAINGNGLVALSEQHLVDCSTAYGNRGCGGGWMDYAYDYAVDNGGFCAASEYPYTATKGVCQLCTRVVEIKGYAAVPARNEAAMLAAVERQPVTLGIQADQPGFQFYKSGVFTGACGASLNHAVVVYGYDTDPSSGLPYWKIRNQWGTDWGEDGYMRMVRNPNLNSGRGQCGMYVHGRYPVQ